MFPSNEQPDRVLVVSLLVPSPTAEEEGECLVVQVVIPVPDGLLTPEAVGELPPDEPEGFTPRKCLWLARHPSPN